MKKDIYFTENLFKNLLNSAPDGIIVSSQSGDILLVNPQIEKLFGYESDELIGKKISKLIPHRFRQKHETSCKKFFLESQIRPMGSINKELTGLQKNGVDFPIDCALSPALIDEGKVVISIVRDITERKNAQEKIIRMERLYSVLSKINKAIVRIRDTKKIYEEACRVAVEEGKLRLAWMGLVDQKTLLVKPVAQRGFEKGYLDNIKISILDIPEGRGPTGTCIREGNPFICNDIANDPKMKPWRNEALKRGYNSSAAFPIKSDNNVIGAFNVYAVEPDFFNKDEISLFEELADDVSFAVKYNDEEQGRKKAELALMKSYDELQNALKGTINVLALAAEKRDPYTAGHQQRVAKLSWAIAIEIGLTEEQADGTRFAGLLHDIGKISVPIEILSKPGKITDKEFEIIQTHPQEAYDILKDINFPWPVALAALQHLERIDGSGYPQGLKGEEIIIEAKIIAVADVVEAMASHRPYRPALGIEKALEEISNNKGELYDSEIVDACIKLFMEKDFEF